MSKSTITTTDTQQWVFDWTLLRDEFPEEYKMDKEEGLSDEDFVRKTFSEIGDDRFSAIVGEPHYDSEMDLIL